MVEIGRYHEGLVEVIVSRDGDDLAFSSAYEDHGRTVVEESRIPVGEFVIKGAAPWPWFDLGAKRAGVLQVLDALGAGRPAWTVPLEPTDLDLFERAHRGDTRVIELLHSAQIRTRSIRAVQRLSGTRCARLPPVSPWP